ncbi:MAG: AmmeMemoRadiSam system protein A [Negativicutes bacterium]|nr:AmmeMemoRadiSam system protein A [Negativicutes bacterium]
MADRSAPVALAWKSLEHYLNRSEPLPPPTSLPTELAGKAGVFVSLKKGGQLRGCIGTFAPTQPTIAAEIIQNAISAATQDPRFAPVDLKELPEIVISVDILSEPEQIDSISQLDPKRYGVIVRCGRRSGLLLPDLEGVDSVEEQVAIAMQKAGIVPQGEVELYRFSVTRYL